MLAGKAVEQTVEVSAISDDQSNVFSFFTAELRHNSSSVPVIMLQQLPKLWLF